MSYHKCVCVKNCVGERERGKMEKERNAERRTEVLIESRKECEKE